MQNIPACMIGTHRQFLDARVPKPRSPVDHLPRDLVEGKVTHHLPCGFVDVPGGVMGKFTNAWSAGQAEKKAAAEADRLEQETSWQTRQRGTADADRWFEDVLTPVMMEAKTDLASQDLEVQFNKVLGDPIRGAFSISGNDAKVVSGTIRVWSNGFVAFDTQGSLFAIKGSVNSTTRDSVEKWLLDIVLQIARH
jgi:hypothetical protein